MKSAALLLRLGHRAGSRSGARGRVHRWALVGAALTTVLAGWLFVGIFAASEHRTERIAAREPVLVQPGHPSERAYWRLHSDVFDDRQFLVLYVAPISELSPPPGLPRWPKPGEVFLSTALLNADRSGMLQQRYGEVGGVIGPNGLAEPSEWLAYYRPASDVGFERALGMRSISGFGIDPDRMQAAGANSSLIHGNWSATDIMVLAGCVVAIPVAVLVFVAVRTNADRRDRRLALLESLGASARSRTWVLVGEAAFPVLLGVAAGVLAAWATSSQDVAIPLTGYVVAGSDLADATVWLVPLGIAAAVAIFSLVVITQLRKAASGQTRPRALRAKIFRWAPGMFVLGMAVAAWGAESSGGRLAPGYPGPLLAFLAGLVLTLVALPSAIGRLAALIGRLFADLGRRWASAAAVVGGQSLAARPMVIARASAALVIGVGLLVQILVQQSWVIQRTRAIAEAPTAAVARVGDSLVAIRTLAAEVGEPQFTNALGSEYPVIRVINNEEGSPSVLHASCVILEQLGELDKPCPTSPVDIQTAYRSLSDFGMAVRLGTEISESDFAVTTMPPASGNPSGYFVLNPHGEHGVETIRRAAYHHLAKPYVSTPGQDWIVGGLAGIRAYNWLLSLGTLGLIALVAAGILSAMGVFLAQVDTLGVLTTYSARRRLYLAIAAWNLGVPTVVAGLAGVTAGAVLGWLAIHMRSRGQLPVAALGWSIGSIALLATAMALAGGLVAAASARSWRPAND